MATLTELIDRHGITLHTKQGDKRNADMGGDSRHWRCTLRRRARTYSFDFWQGSAHKEPPTASDTLECLLSDASLGQLDFCEFCGELGYDTDSRRARRTWRACQRTESRLLILLGEHFDDFMYSDR